MKHRSEKEVEEEEGLRRNVTPMGTLFGLVSVDLSQYRLCLLHHTFDFLGIKTYSQCSCFLNFIISVYLTFILLIAITKFFKRY